ncbi:hypothetical protein N8487_00230, partial [bacterium]|nr:hypothetical protein [bacterium]
MNTNDLKRPGISSKTLTEAGVFVIQENSDPAPIGSLSIPYHDTEKQPTGFCRYRLPQPKGDQRYHQPKGSGSRAYLPPQLWSMGESKDLVIVEG